jgi:[ribosomal protein S5]-alanine N-acetyltransferase
MLEEVQNHQLQTIHAKTTCNNVASQKVLEKNSFKLVSKNLDEVVFNGEKLSFFHYEWKK